MSQGVCRNEKSLPASDFDAACGSSVIFWHARFVGRRQELLRLTNVMLFSKGRYRLAASSKTSLRQIAI